ncbi:MAG: glycosyltransferase [Erysipelotrichia bacterium]|nr:glycosyltransferase [Erysipelotrichia bacterium]
MNVKVSIIVPVYNCEKSIERCIKSIINQTYDNIEIIIVDDGSKDNSAIICDELAKNDLRIKVVHQQNKGVSAARNNAISISTGQYLQFVDSDDWLPDYTTTTLTEAAIKTGADLIIGDFYRVIGKRISTKGKIKSKKVFSLPEYADYMIKNPADFYYGVLWNKLYRRSIIEKYNIRMLENLHWCEDFIFNLEYIKYCHIFYAVQVPIYYYVRNNNSLSNNNLTANKIFTMKCETFTEFNKFYQQILSEDEYQLFKPKIYRFFIDMATDGGVSLKNTVLGQESVRLSDYALKNDNILLYDYRKRKLFYSFLEPLTYKYNLNYNQLVIMYFLSQNRNITKDDLSDILNLSKQQILIELQLMEFKSILQIENKKGYCINISDYGYQIIREIKNVEDKYFKFIYGNLTIEQQQTYEALNKQIDKTITKQLLNKSEMVK